MQTRIHFLDELSRLNHDVLAMGTRVEESLRKATEALKSQNVELAREVKASDEVINALQLKIEDQAAVLIATQQPVARDLRELVTVFKVTDNLERAGDHAVHLAKAAIKLSGEPPFRQIDRLCRMAEIECGMIHRIENQGPCPLVFIEVQRGDYLGEDDIERLEDDFDRAPGSPTPEPRKPALQGMTR